MTSNWSSDYFVGSNTFANVLLIRNSAVLTNADGHVGYMQASSSNSVMITGAGSVWSNANIYLGDSGGANTLVISNAGRIANSLGTYIANNATSSSNRVLVAGTNSVWNCANNLSLGASGSDNSLVISNGGGVIDSYSELGGGSTSSGNSAVITGAGSVWSNVAGCTVGNSGSNNRMTVNKGAHLYSSSATVGGTGSATNNSILVSDSGSLWDNSAVASVISFGMNGSGNSLIVGNGGQVLGYYADIGEFDCGNNSVLVTGSNSGFSVNCYIYTGYLGHDNTFTVADGAAVADKFCYVSYTAVSSNNSVLITGTNSTWQNSYSVFVGFDGTGGSLTISNGATMGESKDGALGYDATSRNNRALVTGGGSVWNCSGNLCVGLNGPLNNLVISNGGRVIDSSGFVGANPGSDGNSALVVGANSVWTNKSDVWVGGFSVGNSLVISNGGRVISGNGFLGRNPGSDSNSVMVTGASSVWTNSSNVYVGCFGVGNSLVISDGGRVIDDWGEIGYDTNSFNNQALVAGAGSVWSNATAMLVGNSGPGNSLEIRDGGLVDDYWGIVGEGESSSNNSVYVESGGVWRNQQLAVGDQGSHNALFVEGGSVFATNMVVGYDPLYCNNLVQLDSGQVIVTNSAGGAVLEVYGGSFALLGGLLRVDTLIVTNDCAQFMHIGGTLIYKTLILNPSASAVGDGIPNGWKQQYGLDPFDPNVANEDPDGDGLNNLQEFLAGSNPVADIKAITRKGNDIRITWQTAAAKTNALQAAGGGSYATNGFTDIFTVTNTDGSVTNYLDAGAATNSPSRFYRVRLVP